MKTCVGCNEAKLLTEFHKNVTMKDGRQSKCKACMKPVYREHRNKNIEHYREAQNQRKRAIMRRFHAWKIERGCAVNGCEERDPVCLELHHTNPSEKDATPSALASYSWERLMKEALKCKVVCSNCHKKIHAKRKTHRGFLVHTTKVRPKGKQDKVILRVA